LQSHKLLFKEENQCYDSKVSIFPPGACLNLQIIIQLWVFTRLVGMAPMEQQQQQLVTVVT
jgi:hypothetical protein